MWNGGSAVDLNTIVDIFIKVVFTEFIKNYGDLKLFSIFTKKTLKKHLTDKSSFISEVKTMMYYNNPIDIWATYEPLRVRDNGRVFYIEKAKDLFEGTNFICLIGDAGSGKTTYSKVLFLKSIENNYKIPVFISLRKMQNNINLIDLIRDEINADVEFDNVIKAFLEEGLFLIILDGYDESNALGKNESSNKLDPLFYCMKKYDKNNYLITSRPFAGARRLPYFYNFYIEPLNIKERSSFISKQLIQSGQQDLQNSIMNSIDHCPENFINEFLKNPLLLLIYIITYRYSSDIPRKRYIFYRRVFNTLFLIHDSISMPGVKRRPYYSDVQQHTLEKIIEKFAFLSYSNGIRTFDREFFVKIIDKIGNHLSFGGDPDLLLKDLLVNIPIFYKEDDKIFFSHSSIQEYFCVSYIKNLSNDSSKEKAYEKITKGMQRRYFFEINNIVSMFIEMDKVNFYKYFYIPSIKNIRTSIFSDFSRNEFLATPEKEKVIIAKYFLRIFYSGFHVERDGNSFMVINRKFSAAEFILQKFFRRYVSLSEAMFMCLCSNLFSVRYSRSNKDQKSIVKIIIELRGDIVEDIGNLIKDISYDISKKENYLVKSIEEESLFLEI